MCEEERYWSESGRSVWVYVYLGMGEANSRRRTGKIIWEQTLGSGEIRRGIKRLVRVTSIV